MRARTVAVPEVVVCIVVAESLQPVVPVAVQAVRAVVRELPVAQGRPLAQVAQVWMAVSFARVAQAQTVALPRNRSLRRIFWRRQVVRRSLNKMP